MPRITGAGQFDAQVAIPTTYKLDYINLTNHNGDIRDIQHLVVDFTITESIYTPSLVLTLNIRDSVNFLEEFQLSGQERISVSVSRGKRFGSTEVITVTADFVVTEYPTYGKFPKTQVYAIKAISEPAYQSKFKRISRASAGDVKSLVHTILKNDLNYSENKIYISSRDMLSASLIVPNLPPIDAISWILRRCFDQSGSPWYYYETFDGGVNIFPQSELVNPENEAFRTFKEGQFFKYDIYTPEDYIERQERIISMASDLRMSKYIAGGNGAYSSRSVYVDIAKKTIDGWRFNYIDDYHEMTWLNRDSGNLSPDFGFRPGSNAAQAVSNRSIADMYDAQINYIPTNSLAYTQFKNYHSGTTDGRINRAQSYIENLDNVTHDLRVAGDFQLSAGKIVNLKVYRSIDPGVEVKNARETSARVSDDEMLSGRHLVTGVVHNFGEDYFCDIKVKKDSLAPGSAYY